MFWFGVVSGSIITFTLVLVLSCLVAASRADRQVKEQRLDLF
ncbi:MAG: hypothetical protein ACRCST_14425 [Turicibacter sp.]